jgi:asparagine synthase (glutamine-hydrolysing)
MPLVDAETGVVVVYNGELYNHLVLRSDLESHGHRFWSKSDTEVLLRSYLEWGTSCVQRFNGMWAFAIWDPRINGAFVSRDRFGVKPLFMACTSGCVAFASEPKVLLSLFGELRVPDDGSLYGLLAGKRVYADNRSFYRQIQVFPAGHYCLCRPGDRTPALNRYWQLPSTDPNATMSWPAANEEFAALLDDAVRLRLRTDVPLGLTLSGGLDSTAIAHAARKALPAQAGLTAYTSVYAQSGSRPSEDEREWAELAISSYHNTELRRVSADPVEWQEVLRRIVWHMDGPGFSPAVFPLWHLARQAHADGVKVLLEGQGADELLGGYSWHTAAALLDNLRRTATGPSRQQVGDLLSAIKLAPRLFSGRRVAGDLTTQLLPPLERLDTRRGTVATALRPELHRDAATSLNSTDSAPGDRVNARLRADFTTDLLPGFLHYGDAVMMAHSVENRLPFMDYRLVDLCFRLPGAYKVRAGRSKALLRRYLHQAGQHAIANRERKQGYPTPTNRWMAADGGTLLRHLLLDRDACVRDYVVERELLRLIDRHVDGNFASGDSLFSLVCTELWLQECIRAPVPSVPA